MRIKNYKRSKVLSLLEMIQSSKGSWCWTTAKGCLGLSLGNINSLAGLMLLSMLSEIREKRILRFLQRMAQSLYVLH